MIIVCIRTIILYLVVLFAIRLMGSSELSKMSPVQMVVTFMIAELASIPIDSPTASLINGVVAIITLMFLQVVFSFISTKSEKIKDLLNSKPILLIEQGKINVKEMKNQRITVNDLFEQLRIGNCPSLSDVEYAILESNGSLSIITTTQNELPLLVVSDGVIYNNNLTKSGNSVKQLEDALKIRGIKNLSDVFIAFYDGNNQLHVYPVPPQSEIFTKEVV